MIVLSCYATGRVAGILDNQNNVLIVNGGNETVPVTYNRSFSTWLKYLTPEQQSDIANKCYVYSVLPKTHNHHPYLVYEVIGVDKKESDYFEKFFICGKVILHNPECCYALVRVPKANTGFTVRVEIPNSLLSVANIDTLLDCYVHFECVRVSTALSVTEFSILAYPEEPVKVIFQDGYLSTTGYLLDYSLSREDYCLVKPIEGEYKGKEIKLYRFSNYLSYSQPFCEEVRTKRKEEVLEKYKNTIFKIRARSLNGRLLIKLIRPL